MHVHNDMEYKACIFARYLCIFSFICYPFWNKVLCSMLKLFLVMKLDLNVWFYFWPINYSSRNRCGGRYVLCQIFGFFFVSCMCNFFHNFIWPHPWQFYLATMLAYFYHKPVARITVRNFAMSCSHNSY